MKVKTIPSTWMRRDDRRLDCGPYMSGALEASIRIEEMSCPKELLVNLTEGHAGGIYNGPQFTRNFVDNPKYGVPFLGTSSMLRADLSDLPLLRKRDAYSPKLNYLRVKPGMTLISCSGTIGRMAYARPDMGGIWSNQDILKIVPDASKIPPGYVFAFLNSRYGAPLVASGTYGAVIPHIEPEHVAKLPVPRLGQVVEGSAHAFIDEAARLLSAYQSKIEQATKLVFEGAGVWNPNPAEWHADKSDKGFMVSSRQLHVLRAWNLSRRAKRIRDEIEAGPHSLLGELVDESWLRWRVMFKRIDADHDYGIEVVTQRPLFHLLPEGRWVSRKYLLELSERFVVPDKTILIAKQGTLGEQELYCRCEYITGGRMLARAYSDHCMRLVADPAKVHPGYLFAFLRSDAGFRLLRALSEGGKQQDLHWRTVPLLPIPRLGPTAERVIGDTVDEAFEARNQAIENLLVARMIVENAIEEAT